MFHNQIINIVTLLVAQVLPIADSGKVSSSKINHMSCRHEATFKTNGKGFMVKGSSSTLKETMHAPLLSHCARRCLKTNECKSVIYKKRPATQTEKNCQILNVEKIDLTNDDILSSTGWVYYEPLLQGTSRCQPDTCQAGYECVETCDNNVPGQYTCNEINECESNPCKNGALCSDRINSYYCTCNRDYVGINCEIHINDINKCHSGSCMNGGTCYNHGKSYSCKCTDNYMGPSCFLPATNFITSPNYPSHYNHSIVKEWKIHVSSGRAILYFHDFHTESYYDNVTLRDGSSLSSPVIATLNSVTGLYRNYIASGTDMLVKFTTDHSVTFKGFRASTGRI